MSQSCTASLGARPISAIQAPDKIAAAGQRPFNSRGNAMQDRKWSRREVLGAATASAAGVLFAEPLAAAEPPPTAVTPALIEAARKEGKVSFYTALELNVAERLARTFEAKYS